MKRYIWSNSAIAAFLLLAAVPAYSAGAGDAQEHVIFPEQSAVLSPASIPELSRQAMGGSIEAAHKLATYYSMIKLDNKDAIFWTQIRVENGDRDARYDLGARLSVDDNLLNRERARYWLTQVESDGPPALADLAKYALQSLNDREKYEQTHKR